MAKGVDPNLGSSEREERKGGGGGGQGPVGEGGEGNVHQSSSSLQNAQCTHFSLQRSAWHHLAPPTAPAPGCFYSAGGDKADLAASDSGVKRHAQEEFDKYSHLKQHSFAHKAPGT